MNCEPLLNSGCPCGCDCVELSAISSTPPIKIPMASSCEPPHEPCCCCRYNPFSDDTRESEIHDLGFALRKLAVMKCQMKKWRMERLQLESETRSLKQTLESFGVNLTEPLKTDPLMVHYRDNNIRLENVKEQLEEKIKDLEETLMERELDEDPCEGARLIRDKMRVLREQSRCQKKKLKETIVELRIKLAEAEDETSCAGVHRLRVKLRDMMKNKKQEEMRAMLDESKTKLIEKRFEPSPKNIDLGKKYISSIHLEVSDENANTIVPNSGSESLRVVEEEIVDDKIILDKENEWLEVKKMSKRYDKESLVVLEEMEERVIPVIEDENLEKDASLRMKMDESYDLVEDLKRKLQEKEAVIQSSQRRFSDDIDKMTISHKALLAEVNAAKEELKRRDNKVEELLAQVGKSSLELLEKVQLHNEIETMKPQLYDLEIQREKLLDELTKIRGVVAERNDHIIDILEQRDKLQNDFSTNDSAMQARIDGLLAQETLNRKKIDELNNQVDQGIQREGEMRSKIGKLEDEMLKAENLAKRIKEKEKEKNDVVNQANNKLTNQIQIANDEINSLTEEKNKLEDKVVAADLEAERLRQELESCRNIVKTLEAENSRLQKGQRELEDNLSKLKSENNSLREDLQECKDKAEILQSDIREIKVEKEKLNKATRLDEELDQVRSENDRLKAELDAFKDMVDKLNKDLSDSQDQTKLLELKNKDFKLSMDKLEKELSNIRKFLENANNQLNLERSAKETAELELSALKDELKNLISKLDEFRKNAENLKIECDAMKQDIITIQSKLSQTSAENVDLKKEASKLRKKAADTENMKKELSELQADVDHWKTENCKQKVDNEKLKTDLGKVKMELETCRAQVEQLDDQYSKSEALQKEIEDFNNTLKSEKLANAEALRKINAQEEELAALKDELIKCRNQTEKEQKEFDNLNKKLFELTEDLTAKKIELTALKNRNDQLGNENEGFKRASIGAKDDFEILKTENNDLRRTSVNLRGESDRLKIENSNLMRELEDLKSRNDSLQSEVKSLASDLENSKNEKEKLKQDLENHGDSQSNINNLKKDLENVKNVLTAAEATIKNLEKTIEALNAEKKSLLAELDSKRNEVLNFQKVLDVKEPKVKDSDEYSTELVALKREFDKCQSDRERHKADIDLLKSQIDSLRHENDGNKLQLNKLQIEKDDCNKKLQQAENDLKENDLLRKLSEDLSKMVKDLESALDKSSKETKKIQQEYAALLNKESLNSGKVKELEALKDTLGNVRKELGSQTKQEPGKSQDEALKLKEDLEMSQEENRKLFDQVNNLNKELVQVNGTVGGLKSENDRLKGELEKARIEVGKMTEAIEKVTAEKGQLKNEKEKLDVEQQAQRREIVSPIGTVDISDELKKEVESLKAENKKLKDDLAKLKNEFNNLQGENNVLKDGIDDDSKLKKVMDNMENLRKDRDKLENDVNKLKSDLDRVSGENELLKGNADESLKFKIDAVDMENLRSLTDDLKVENQRLRNSLDETKHQADQYGKDNEKLKLEVAKLTDTLESLRRENEIFKSNSDDSTKVAAILNELDGWKKRVENLTTENDRLKKEIDDNRNGRKFLESNIDGGTKMESMTKIITDVPTNSTASRQDLLMVLEFLKNRIDLQLLGISRIKNRISEITRQIWTEKSIPRLSDNFDTIVAPTDPLIKEILEQMDNLTDSISSAEKDLVKLGETLKDQWAGKEQWKNFPESSEVGGTLGASKFHGDQNIFDPETWLKSLTLEQLADLHNRISILSSALVDKDTVGVDRAKAPVSTAIPLKNPKSLQASYEALNRKIAALQRQIAKKYTETDKKVQEMRVALRREQAELIKISEAMNHERKRNLSLNLSVDGSSPCWINNCMAECSEYSDFFDP